jgi:hypothetical protein
MFPPRPLVADFVKKKTLVAEAIHKIETHNTGFIGAAKLLVLVAGQGHCGDRREQRDGRTRGVPAAGCTKQGLRLLGTVASTWL